MPCKFLKLYGYCKIFNVRYRISYNHVHGVDLGMLKRVRTNPLRSNTHKSDQPKIRTKSLYILSPFFFSCCLYFCFWFRRHLVVSGNLVSFRSNPSLQGEHPGIAGDEDKRAKVYET